MFKCLDDIFLSLADRQILRQEISRSVVSEDYLFLLIRLLLLHNHGYNFGGQLVLPEEVSHSQCLVM